MTSRYGLTQKFDIQGSRWRPRRPATFLIEKSGKSSTNRSMTRWSISMKTVEACERQKLKN